MHTNSANLRPLAVVTGASNGIGGELARLLAADGFDLVVAAEDEGIAQAARDLATNGTTVEPVQADLATHEGVDELARRVGEVGRPVEVLALNAGVGAGGAFVSGTRLEDELRLVDLNVRSTVHLAKLLVPAMAAAHHGRVLFTSSIASAMPGPYQAVYNASKSFVQSFALALRSELKGTGVTVTSLMPGPTDTGFFARARMLDTKVGAGAKDDPRAVARAGYEALMDGRERAVASSLSSRLQGRGSRLLPDSVKSALHARLARPGSAGS